MTKSAMFVICAMVVMGCAGFDPAPENVRPVSMSDAAMPATDAATTDSGHARHDGGRAQLDGGMEMPREIDGGAPIGDVPAPGDACDPDVDTELYDCDVEEWCPVAYLLCKPSGVWRCEAPVGTVCVMPHPEADAGMPATDAGSPAVDAGRDAGTRDAGRDAGPVVVDAGTRDAGRDAGPIMVDAGRTDSCRADTLEICLRDPACGALGYRLCNTASGNFDGECLHFVGQDCPVIVTDAGSPAVDAGPRDAGRDLGTDAGPVVVDAGTDAGRDLGVDAGPPPVVDAGTDAGSTLTLEILFGVDATALPRPVAELSLREEIATASSTLSELELLDCDPATRGMVTESGLSYYRCRVTRPVDASLLFVGRIDFTDGSVWHSVSGWGRTSCDNPTTSRIESATPGMRWIVRTLAGASRLPPSGIPSVTPLYSITEDTFPVCRHELTFTRP